MMTRYRFNRRRVPANAVRRRGIPGVLDVRALAALAGRKPLTPGGAEPAVSGPTTREMC
jgi:hypothetical protein